MTGLDQTGAGDGRERQRNGNGGGSFLKGALKYVVLPAILLYVGAVGGKLIGDWRTYSVNTDTAENRHIGKDVRSASQAYADGVNWPVEEWDECFFPFKARVPYETEKTEALKLKDQSYRTTRR